jgi:hypothetical protein
MAAHSRFLRYRLGGRAASGRVCAASSLDEGVRLVVTRSWRERPTSDSGLSRPKQLA